MQEPRTDQRQEPRDPLTIISDAEKKGAARSMGTAETPSWLAGGLPLWAFRRLRDRNQRGA